MATPPPVRAAPASAFRKSHILAAFAAVYVVWGSTYLAIRYAVETIPPFFMGGTRFLVSGAILYAWARRRGAPRPTVAQWRDATITGVLMLCCGNGGVAWAEQRVPSGLSAVLVAVVPLWMVVLNWARPNGVRPRALEVLGVFVGLAGLVVLVGPGAIAGRGTIDFTAAIVLVIASLAWAAGSVYNRFGARPESSAMSTGMQMLGGCVLLLLVSAAFGEARTLETRAISRVSLMGWSYLVTFGSLVGFTAYIYLLRAVTPAQASTYAYVNPVVAVFLGWAIAGEPVTPRMLAAAAIILGGVAMISLRWPSWSDRVSGRATPAATARFFR